jgi:hypothetical protein
MNTIHLLWFISNFSLKHKEIKVLPRIFILFMMPFVIRVDCTLSPRLTSLAADSAVLHFHSFL